MVLTCIHTGTAANTAVNVIILLVHTHDSKIIEVSLYTVIGASCNRNLDVVVGRENDFLNLPCQFICIDVALDAVGVADAGHDVTGANGGISVVIDIHVHVTHLHVHFFDIALDEFIYFFNILILNPRYVQGLPGTHMEGPVSETLAEFLHHGQVLCLYHGAGHPHLKHELPSHLGLPEAVNPYLFDIYIMIHSLPPLS